MTDDAGRKRLPPAALYALKLAALAAFVVWTNSGFLDRVALLVGQTRWVTLIGFVGVWGLSLCALLVAAFQANVWLRAGWAAVIAVTTAAGYAYSRASGSDLGVLDALSLWNARHEAGRAASFYAADIWWLVAAMVVGFAVMTMPPVPKNAFARRWLARAAWLPAFPIAAIAVIVMVKEGGGSESLPRQFGPLSVGIVLGGKLAARPIPARAAVSLASDRPFAPDATPVRRIVLLVDESVRADYIDWTSGNPYTPQLAALKDRVVDFGPAASGGNCSHYANAILRFAAAPDDIGGRILSHPTLWQYAKKAGFRTVYIDGQSGFNRNPGKLQNFMTAAEARSIDGFHTFGDDTAAPQLDDRVSDIVLAAMKTPGPVFIYANKNGAHFPYDEGYPDKARLFRPTMSDVADDTSATRIRSYRNVLRWSVDRVVARLIAQADLRDTVIIYTSDHGQAFFTNRLTHCSVEGPDPREALVPLFVATDNPALRARLEGAARASVHRGSHFLIAPTVLTLLGFDEKAVIARYGASLLAGSPPVPRFTTGDIFGLFADRPRLHAIDLSKSYREPEAEPPLAPPHTAQVGQGG